MHRLTLSLVDGIVKLPSRVSRRFAATSWRFRPTPLQLFGIAICAAILAFLSWTNPPRPLTVDAVAPTIDSGGLGLTRQEWTDLHGLGSDHLGQTARYIVSPRQQALVFFLPETPTSPQVVQQVELAVNFVGAPPVSEDDASTLAMSLLPSDTVFVRRVTMPVPHFRIVTTDFLASESLSRLYPRACRPERFGPQSPGDIRIAIYRDENRALPSNISVYWTCFTGRP